MNHILMAEWIKKMFIPEVQAYLQDEGIPRYAWKVVLLVDNCPGHGSVQWMNRWCPDWLKIVNLPPNTTSVIQPMDGGAIMKFKRRYRRHLLRLMVTMECRNVEDFIKQFNIYHAITLIEKAMYDLECEELRAIWDRTIFTGLLIDKELTDEEEQAEIERRREQEPGYWVKEAMEEEKKIEAEIDALAKQLSGCGIDVSEVSEWLDIDNRLPSPDVEEVTVEKAIEQALGGISNIDLAVNGNASSDEEGGDSDMELDSPINSHAQEVQQSLLKAAAFFDKSDTYYRYGQLCRDLAYKAHEVRMESLQQASILDFFGGARVQEEQEEEDD